MISVAWHALRRRRSSLLWWAIGTALLAALLAVAYPTVRDNNELDNAFANLSPGVENLLGLTGNPLSSPAGYLNSQFFANLLPLMLLIFGIGMAAWTVAGDEAAGTFELLVANPISRIHVALSRLTALLLLMGLLAAVAALTLILLAQGTGLNKGLTNAHLIAATVAATLTALTYSALAFAIGAATGNRPAAIAAPASLAVGLYAVEGIDPQVAALRPLRAINPWHWLLAGDPLINGLTWRTWALPLVVSGILIVAALPLLARRDLR